MPCVTTLCVGFLVFYRTVRKVEILTGLRVQKANSYIQAGYLTLFPPQSLLQSLLNIEDIESKTSIYAKIYFIQPFLFSNFHVCFNLLPYEMRRRIRGWKSGPRPDLYDPNSKSQSGFRKAGVHHLSAHADLQVHELGAPQARRQRDACARTQNPG